MSVRNQRLRYGPTPYTPLLPRHARERRFKLVGLGRRGLESDHVYAFLERVAVDMAAVQAALAARRREAACAEDELRRQQSGADRGSEG